MMGPSKAGVRSQESGVSKRKAEGRRQKAEGRVKRLELNEQPSPLGRGWPAAGAFISRSGTGEGFLTSYS